MKTYKLETVDGHLLAHLPQGLSLIDTGSPISMQPPTIVLDATQRPIKHLLGNDELSRSRILLDSVNGEYVRHVDRMAGEEFPLRPCLGVFQIALGFRDQQWHACLDTGARLSYVTPEAVVGLTPIGNEPDFHPLLGAFDVPVYELTITVGSRTITGRFGVLPESLGGLLSMFGLNGWILGSDFFRDRSIILDLDHNLVVDVTVTLAERKRLERGAVESQREPTLLNRLLEIDAARRRDFRPRLRTSKRDALDYHVNAFDDDLRLVIGGASPNWINLSIASFCPGDPPAVPMYSEPANAFSLLDNQRWFLCSLFASQLVDQASHHVTGSVRQMRAGTLGQIRLVGLLGGYYNAVHPSFLLLLLGLYRLHMHEEERVANGIRAALSIELRYMHATADERSRIFSQLRRAIAVASTPTSLRAFLPNGDDNKLKPNFDVVEKLRVAAASVVVHAMNDLTLLC
jgi:hypothetical protein